MTREEKKQKVQELIEKSRDLRKEINDLECAFDWVGEETEESNIASDAWYHSRKGYISLLELKKKLA